MEAVKLSEHPQIIDLVKVLEENGLVRQKEEVQSLVGYIEGMESQLAQMLEEVQQMHSEVGQIHDGTLRAKCSRLVTMAENKIRQVGSVLSLTKGRLVASAQSALRSFQEKGRASLRRAVDAMHIPSVLARLKSGLHHAVGVMEQGAARTDAIRQELHEAGDHMKNAGRSLTGKPVQQAQALEADKGVLAKLRGFFVSCGTAFSSMEQSTARFAEKFQPEGTKRSVKSELKELRAAHTDAPVKPAGKEKTR